MVYASEEATKNKLASWLWEERVNIIVIGLFALLGCGAGVCFYREFCRSRQQKRAGYNVNTYGHAGGAGIQMR